MFFSCIVAWSAESRAESWTFSDGDKRIITGVWLLAGVAVPKYSVIHQDQTLHGMKWEFPIAYKLGFVQDLAVSLAYYPHGNAAVGRAIYEVPIRIGKSLEPSGAFVPGAGGFTSPWGQGVRVGGKLWWGMAYPPDVPRSQTDYPPYSVQVDRALGAFVGAAWERNLTLGVGGWEISLGVEIALNLHRRKDTW
jgi:hypothetical protein